MVQKEEKRARGRPRSFDEQEVLEKARGVFWDLGFAATSLDDIAAATGLNRPSLYAAFGDKRSLYLTALKRTNEGSLAAIAAMLGREGPVSEVLNAFYDAAITVYRAGDAGPRGCFVVGTAVTEAVDDADVRALLGSYLAETDKLFAARFAAAPEEIRPGVTPEGAAGIASATLHTLAIRARAGAAAAELKAIAQAAVSLLCV
jgi:TetR/AcrR family transcriptional regulator, copper-responsive repressor